MRHVPDNEQCMRLESANLDCGHFCAKENGIPVCKCKVGYRHQDNECIEIDECASYEWNRNVWEFPCKDNELCENHAGSFTCIVGVKNETKVNYSILTIINLFYTGKINDSG
jgi:hypothetical protein